RTFELVGQYDIAWTEAMIDSVGNNINYTHPFLTLIPPAACSTDKFFGQICHSENLQAFTSFLQQTRFPITQQNFQLAVSKMNQSAGICMTFGYQLKLEDINFILLRQYYRDDYPSLKSILDPYRKLEEFITHRQFERIRQHCADHQIKPHENAMQLASNIGHWVGVQLLVSLGGKVTS